MFAHDHIYLHSTNIGPSRLKVLRKHVEYNEGTLVERDRISKTPKLTVVIDDTIPADQLKVLLRPLKMSDDATVVTTHWLSDSIKAKKHLDKDSYKAHIPETKVQGWRFAF